MQHGNDRPSYSRPTHPRSSKLHSVREHERYQRPEWSHVLPPLQGILPAAKSQLPSGSRLPPRRQLSPGPRWPHVLRAMSNVPLL